MRPSYFTWVVMTLLSLVAPFAAPHSAWASDGEQRELSLEDVLESVTEHLPVIVAARAELSAARGAQLAAEGGFDPTVSLKGNAVAEGYYRYRRMNAEVEQPTPLWGTSFIAGWRWSDGNIPDYYGEYNTLSGGELRLGVRVPLLRDGSYDARRAAVAQTEAGTAAATAKLASTRLKLIADASAAYYGWVASGQKLRIAERLLELAESRDEFVRGRVANGAIPSIEALENQRAVLRRKSALVEAERDFKRAAIRLALYHRDHAGEQWVPEREWLPAAVSLHVPEGENENHVALARAQRPELQEASAKLAAGAAAVRLARNRVAPRLDFELFGSKDLGDAPTEEERDRLARPQLEGGVLFKIPIPLRTDRGQRRNAEAKQAALEADVRWLRDQLQAEVGDVLARLRAAREQIELTEAAVRVSQAVAQGERERFELGVSTLLHVNLREEAAADAEAAHTVAEAELAVTSVLFDVVRGFDPSASRVGDG